MKALVTGAAGFIGSTLSERLIADGATVVGLDCFTDYYPRERKEHNLTRLRQSPGFTLVEAAIADADLPRLLEGVTHVFHLAAQAGVRKSWGRDFRVYTVNNVEATQILLEACVGRPLKRLVYASSSSVYGDNVALPMTEDALPQPVSPYGVTKLSAEQLVPPVPGQLRRASRVGAVFHGVRPPAASGHGVSQVPAGGHAGRTGAAIRGWTADPRLHVRGRRGVGDDGGGERGTPGGVYNIGGGSRVELLDVFELIHTITGRPLRIEPDRRPARRHARYLRGYDPCTRGPRVRANRVARAGTSSAVRVDDRGRPLLIGIDD